MRVIFFFLIFYLNSCGYPDIDSVPSFDEFNLTDEELFDLCELSSNDKSEFNKCIEEKRNNSWNL